MIEVDGVAVCRAQEIEIGGIKHEPYKIFTGDRPNPMLGRAKYEIEPVKIKHAMVLGNAGAEFVRLARDYVLGLDLTKVTVRVITLDESGFSPVAEDEFTECVFTSFVPEGKKGDSKDAAHFTIEFKPTDHVPSY